MSDKGNSTGSGSGGIGVGAAAGKAARPLKVVLLFVLAVGVLYYIVGNVPHEHVATAVTFRTGLAQAAQQAREANKVVFADFYAGWCGPCRAMDKEVFSRREFAASLEEMAVPLRVDLETPEGAALAGRYRVEFIPTYIVMRADGSVLGRGESELSAEKLLDLVRRSVERAKGP